MEKINLNNENEKSTAKREIKHAFVTGATGLLGNNLVRALVNRGIKVTGLVRNIKNAKINKTFEFSLPESMDKRIILEILKLQKTEKKYPRKIGIPSKKPL